MKQFIFATLAMLALCFNAGATEYHGTFVGNLIPPMTTTLTSSNGSMSFSQSINPVGGVNYDLNVISGGSVNFSSQFTTNSGQVTIQSLAASLITGLAATIGAQVQGSNYLTSSSNITAGQITSPPWITNNPVLTNQIYSTNIVSNGNSTGVNNRFMGQNSGNNTMTGSDNTGLGLNTLIGDTTGSDNTAIGFTALINNKTGIDNTVMGSGAMASNTNGSYNISIGFDAMYNSLSSAGNIAIGNSSLINTSGNNNTAIGDNSMTACTTGSYNLGDGFESFPNLLTGQYNIAFGTGAGVNITNGNYNIDISASGTLDETGIIRIGTTGKQTATYLTGIVYGNGSGITNIPLTGLTNADLSGTQTNNQAWTTNGIGTNYFGWWTNYNGLTCNTNIYPWGTNTAGSTGETNIYPGTPNTTNWITSAGFSVASGPANGGVGITNTFSSTGLITQSIYGINSVSTLIGGIYVSGTIFVAEGYSVDCSNYRFDDTSTTDMKELSTGTILVTSNGYFQGVCGATNGFASWSTNQLAPGYAAGWTNLGTVGGITNRMYANVIGTSGSIVYWGRTGANGVTPCGFPIFTNTVSVVGQVIPVGVNCGIQINSGVGVTITPYSQGE